jgi:hypothetical protein
VKGLIDWPFVPHINSREPCYFAEVPDGSQTYTLYVILIQEEGAQICMSHDAKISHSHTVLAGLLSSAPHLHNGAASVV